MSKKRHIQDEDRTFQKRWTEKFFFVEHEEKAMCLICKQKVAVMKDCNLKRHCQKNHATYHSLCEHQRLAKIEKLQKAVVSQQSMFKKMNEKSQASMKSLNKENLLQKVNFSKS